VIVQYKRYTSQKVSSPEIQKFIGMMITEYKAKKGIYITTTDFTKPARELAIKHGIELWNGAKIAKLLIEQRKKMQREKSFKPSNLSS